MSQSSPTIGANKSGLAYRQEDNDGKTALLSHHKGSTTPTYAEAGMIWLDDASTPWLLKLHDGTDWITMGAVHATHNTFQPYLGTEGLKILPFAVETGSANTYAATPIPAITAYDTGQMMILKPSNTNTGASSIALNGLTAKAIKTPEGEDLDADTLIADQMYILLYDGTDFIVTNAAPAVVVSAETLPDGCVVNNVYDSYSDASDFLYSNIPHDNTIPQKTEGTEIISASITPQSITNKLRISIQGFCAHNTANSLVSALFQDDIADAIAASATSTGSEKGLQSFRLTHEYCPATTDSVTLKLRVGNHDSYIRMNGHISGRILGGVARTTMTIEEIKAS